MSPQLGESRNGRTRVNLAKKPPSVEFIELGTSSFRVPSSVRVMATKDEGQIQGGYPLGFEPKAPEKKPLDLGLSLRKKMGVMSLGSLGAVSSRSRNSDASSRSSRFKTPSVDSFQPASDTPRSQHTSRASVAASVVSDSEASDLEPESDLESVADEPVKDSKLKSFDAHPAICTPLPRAPVCLPNCKNAKQLATAGAADSSLGIRQSRLISASLAPGELIISTEGHSEVIHLLGSEVAWSNGTTTLAQDLCVISIVPPESMKPRQMQGRSHRPSIAGSLKAVFGRGGGGEGVAGWLFYCNKNDLSAVLDRLGEQGCIRSGLSSFFKASKGERAGSGSFGVVNAGVAMGGSVVAIKTLKESTKPEAVYSEVEMLVRAQGHANVANFRGAFCEADAGSLRWSLIFDYFSHGDLYDRVAGKNRMMEKEAMPFLRDLLEALSHLHVRKIFHRDVKPENLLMANSGKYLVLTDFGIATLVTNQEEMRRSSGTVGYAAPEMLKGEATSFEGDAFGAGVVLYFMLSKSTPFLAPTQKQMAENTHECKVNLKYGCFEHISDDCRSMIVSLIKKEVQERMTIEQALISRVIRRTYVTATEPALAAFRGREQTIKETADQPNLDVVRPAHHLVALTAGELPALKRHNKK
ncbi:unnamed protein product [Effrenium voratum]|uniref:Protein kinase domain-containing protein n=1 Tax=Effrenium voratum TaxID=2562239 RepID=A0AA36IIN3_9DINO|nr:unnamed protein product [Effrenium voratum]CAJ1388148.1 unnamed protein product [Effrenium voratum]